ncbi:MAG TPA: hypothetical protein VEU52_11895, partial [Candidatus Limnocylindrales bacterium]|nr:hypothetical protein [Candidatus Limnocylindrales bacterium]
KMNLGRKLNHLPKEIRARTEALDYAGNLLASRGGAPEIVLGGDLASGIRIFRDANLRGVLRIQRFYFLGEVDAYSAFLFSHFCLACKEGDLPIWEAHDKPGPGKVRDPPANSPRKFGRFRSINREIDGN